MLADRLGVNKGLISRRLNGNLRLSSDTLSDMARALNGRLSMRIDALEDVSRTNEGITAPDNETTFYFSQTQPKQESTSNSNHIFHKMENLSPPRMTATVTQAFQMTLNDRIIIEGPKVIQK